MNLYAVVTNGVYRHKIVGVYDSYELAEKRAVEVCKAESDDTLLILAAVIHCTQKTRR